MSLTAYYGYLDASDLDNVVYDECDAVIALFTGNYEEMTALLKETPEDLPEVLECIYDFPDGIPALYQAFPDCREALRKGLQQRLPNECIQKVYDICMSM